MKMLLFSIVLIYLAFMLVMCSAQSRILYQPMSREHVATPDEIGLHWQNVTLKTSDEVSLHAWWLPHEQPRATVLFLHGNAGNISHRLSSLEQFNSLDLSVFIIDYRGYGQSEGRPSEAGTALDARAAWAWLREEQQLDPAHIVVFGRSLGAAVAAELAREVSPAGLILESPFRSVPLLARQLFPLLPTRLLVRFDYSTVDYVSDIHVPLLVIHSRDDEIIPFSEGRAVYEAANQPKQLLEIRGGHNTGFMVSAREYLAAIDDFLQQLPR